jgi:hypothetical protein
MSTFERPFTPDAGCRLPAAGTSALALGRFPIPALTLTFGSAISFDAASRIGCRRSSADST